MASSILDVRSFRAAEFDTDHYLVFAKVRESLAVSKQTAQKFEGERLNRRKLNDLEVRKRYQIKITNRFAALENISDGKDVNRAWRNVGENIKTSAIESLQGVAIKKPDSCSKRLLKKNQTIEMLSPSM